jgi:hypothetical protein
VLEPCHVFRAIHHGKASEINGISEGYSSGRTIIKHTASALSKQYLCTVLEAIMQLVFTCPILLTATLAATLAATPACGHKMETITWDVAIIGGGVSGMFAATQLQGLGKSFVVIEQKSQFGGHT